MYAGSLSSRGPGQGKVLGARIRAFGERCRQPQHETSGRGPYLFDLFGRGKGEGGRGRRREKTGSSSFPRPLTDKIGGGGGGGGAGRRGEKTGFSSFPRPLTDKIGGTN